MATRKKIVIDRDKCVGCGLCVNACHGGALELVDGKAAVTREDYCDGLGACIGECPVDAIRFEEVEVTAPMAPAATATDSGKAAGFVCPSMLNRVFSGEPARKPAAEPNSEKTASRPTPSALAEKASSRPTPSELNAWPIQLHLVRPEAPQFAGADILIAASCTAFAMGSFHAELLAGRGLIIACPKLDRQEGYLEKLTDLFALAKPAGVTVARMEVPCCRGLINLVETARRAAGSNLPVREVVVGLQGDIIEDRTPASA